MTPLLWFLAGWFANTALLLLPLGALIAWDRWQARRRVRRQVHQLIATTRWPRAYHV